MMSLLKLLAMHMVEVVYWLALDKVWLLSPHKEGVENIFHLLKNKCIMLLYIHFLYCISHVDISIIIHVVTPDICIFDNLYSCL